MAAPVLIALDFETAGYYRHSACAIGLVRIENYEVADEYYHLIRPPSSRICFTHIHGLTWKDLRDEPSFPEIWEDIARFISGADYFIAHNAAFDRSVLRGCCAEFAKPLPAMPFLDTLKGARKALAIDSHKLNIVCEYFGFEIDHHNAASDALGCARIYLKLLKMGVSNQVMLLNTK